MGICSWLILGGLSGWIASMIKGKNASMGMFANIATGVVGAMIGGALFSAVGGSGVTGLNLWSLVVATVGAVIFLSILQALRK